MSNKTILELRIADLKAKGYTDKQIAETALVKFLTGKTETVKKEKKNGKRK